MTGREGRLSWEARAEEVSFEVLPKRCNRGTISYMERKRVPKGRGIVTEGIRKVFNCIPDTKRGFIIVVVLVRVRRDFLLATYSPHFFPDFFHIWQVA